MTYKLFESGETLTANDVQTYFMNQVVIHVDNEADLADLIADHADVRVAYAQDTDKVYALVSGTWEPLAYEGGDFTFDNLTIDGNLIVNGTTTTIDSTTIQVTDSFVFEGATEDGFETTLQINDPTADRTITLPDATGTVALTSDIPSLTGYVTETATQSLTNKTLDSAVLTGTVTADSSVGSNGQVLASTGTGVQWITPSSYALPSQTGNTGKFLTTDGTSESWASISQYSLPSQSGNAGKLLTTNGTSESWSSLTLDEIQIQRVMDYL
jgi:hypothetical protein